MLEVGAQEDQAAGAALALGGGDAGLGALDLAFEGVFPEALARLPGVFFPLLQFLVQGLLAHRERCASVAELARKYSHAKGPQISPKPRGRAVFSRYWRSVSLAGQTKGG